MASPRPPVKLPPVKPQAKLGPVQKSSGKASTGVVGVASRGEPQVAGKLDPTKKVNVAKAVGAPKVSKKVAAQNQARFMADVAKMAGANQVALSAQNRAKEMATSAKMQGAKQVAKAVAGSPQKIGAAEKAALAKMRANENVAAKKASARKAALGMAKGGLVKSTGKLKTGIKGCK